MFMTFDVSHSCYLKRVPWLGLRKLGSGIGGLHPAILGESAIAMNRFLII